MESCRKRLPDLSCLKVERSVTSRFKISLGDFQHRPQELCESRGGHPGLLSLISLQFL